MATSLPPGHATVYLLLASITVVDDERTQDFITTTSYRFYSLAISQLAWIDSGIIHESKLPIDSL